MSFRYWHKSEVPAVSGDVCGGCESGPDADMAAQPPLTLTGHPVPASFDHLIGAGEDRLGNGDA